MAAVPPPSRPEEEQIDIFHHFLRIAGEPEIDERDVQDPFITTSNLSFEEALTRRQQKIAQLLSCYQREFSWFRARLLRSYQSAARTVMMKSTPNANSLSVSPVESLHNRICLFGHPSIVTGGVETAATSSPSQAPCLRRALPFSPYCLQHILHDPEQRLYLPCSAAGCPNPALNQVAPPRAPPEPSPHRSLIPALVLAEPALPWWDVMRRPLCVVARATSLPRCAQPTEWPATPPRPQRAPREGTGGTGTGSGTATRRKEAIEPDDQPEGPAAATPRGDAGKPASASEASGAPRPPVQHVTRFGRPTRPPASSTPGVTPHRTRSSTNPSKVCPTARPDGITGHTRVALCSGLLEGKRFT
ncbi:hypothetical protein PAPYR_420 [Paratrimastix pyriformis]|uniref:KAT8 regulatory NSL complex subunit 2 n=1 Tax=Paratrimastix pyriformis TaxID=342808 RepID=A0ABQ8V0J4_9EUKA|nr:hypothetical protein PAPYR_420 [Paratrimastix pyriformis]